jgi:hypothetical protein
MWLKVGLLMGKPFHYRGTTKPCPGTPSARLRAPGACKRPLAHLEIFMVLADIDADIFEVLAAKTRTRKPFWYAMSGFTLPLRFDLLCSLLHI